MGGGGFAFRLLWKSRMVLVIVIEWEILTPVGEA